MSSKLIGDFYYGIRNNHTYGTFYNIRFIGDLNGVNIEMNNIFDGNVINTKMSGKFMCNYIKLTNKGRLFTDLTASITKIEDISGNLNEPLKYINYYITQINSTNKLTYIDKNLVFIDNKQQKNIINDYYNSFVLSPTYNLSIYKDNL